MGYIYCITNLINNKQYVWNNAFISSGWTNANINGKCRLHHNDNSSDNPIL